MHSDFRSCNWGTSNLRVRPIVGWHVVAEVISDDGISCMQESFSDTLQGAMQEIHASPRVVICGMPDSSTRILPPEETSLLAIRGQLCLLNRLKR